MVAKVRFDDVKIGGMIPERSKVVRREDVKAYADASGDQNPLHQSDEFARSVGFPGIIAHGMFTMAHVVKTLTDWLGDPAALKQIDVQFRAVVFMDETMVAKGQVVELDPSTRRAKVNVWVEVQRDGKRELPIKNSSAVVELA
jgi:acyl dehydratase